MTLPIAIPVLRNKDKIPLAIPVLSLGVAFKIAVLTDGWKKALPTPITICIRTKAAAGVDKPVLENKNNPAPRSIMPAIILFCGFKVPVDTAVIR